MQGTDALEQQRQIYGAPLGDIAHHVMDRLGLTQGRLAEALGLSAPMLSQLMSGQRVKIGNPSVVQRLQSLSELAEEAAGLGGEAVADRIAGIRGESATISGRRTDTAVAVQALRGAAPAEELRRLAALTGAPALAGLLRAAAESPGG